MTGTPRWAMSPLDFRVPLVGPEGSHAPAAPGCGLLLTISVTQHDQPLPPGPITGGRLALPITP